MPRKSDPIEKMAEKLREIEEYRTGPNDHYPWLTTQEFHSYGTRVRARFGTVNRFLHLMSYLEFKHFLCVAVDPDVVDIRDQVPLLPLERTEKIAAVLDVKHPGVQICGEALVMSTDLVVTRKVKGGVERTAYTVKPFEKTKSDIYKAKLRIEREYWAAQKPPVALIEVSEKNLTYDRVRSADWILQATWPNFLSDLENEGRLEVAFRLRRRLTEEHDMLTLEAEIVDNDMALEGGTSVDVARWMLATRRWVARGDTAPFPDRPLILESSS